MIQPKHIHYESCPDCGAPFRMFGREVGTADKAIRQHTNGGIWEYIIFTCERKDAFIPNFDRIQTERPCSNTPETQALMAKRRAAAIRIGVLIENLDVDDHFRDRIRRDYSYIGNIYDI